MRFYTCVDFHADFIEPQIEALRAFSQDEPELIVLDNVPEIRADLRPRIAAECARLKVEYMPVAVRDLAENPSIAHGRALDWALRNVILKSCQRIGAILDFDLFPLAPFSAADVMAGHVLAGRSVGRAPVQHPWPGMLFFDLARLPAPESISFMPGYVGEVWTDTGGPLYTYLQAHPEVTFRDLGGTGGIDDAHAPVWLPPNPMGPAYEGVFGVGVVGRDWLHYVKGTGWHGPDPEVERRKRAYVFSLIRQQIAKHA